MNGQNIRIRLKAFDHRILDASTREIVSTAKRTGAQGPIRCRRASSASRCFARRTSTRSRASSSRCALTSVFDIVDPTPQTVDALMKLDLAAGVDVEIKL